MTRILAAAITFSTLLGFAQPSFAADTTDRARIEQIVETFRVSIINKDKDSFLKLLHSETIPWIGIVSDKTLALDKMRQKDPKAPEPEKIFSGTPKGFIEGIVSNPARIEEKFDNVRIDSDGDVAQVMFDYSFNKNDYKQNWGKESWHLIRTSTGWKISSVIWSMEFNPVPPPKAEPKKS